MKHYLRYSLILAIFLPLFAIAQESAYPNKGFQVEVGTGLWQPTPPELKAAAIPLLVEFKYKLKKIDFGLGVNRGILALGENYPLIFTNSLGSGSYFPFKQYRIVSVNNPLSKTTLYYLSVNYTFKKKKPSFIVGGGIGKCATDELKTKDYYPDATTNQNSFGAIAAKEDFFSFLQIGYSIGQFRNYLSLNWVTNKSSIYNITNYYTDIDPFFSFKTAINLNLKKKGDVFDIANPEDFSSEERIANRRYKLFGLDFGISTLIPIDKTAKATAFGPYFEPRVHINDNFTLGVRYGIFGNNTVDPNTYRFEKQSYGKDTIVVARYESAISDINYTYSLIGDQKVSEKENFRLFLGGGVSVIERFYRSYSLGVIARATSNFGHLRSGLSLNYVGSKAPFHAALQFGFEIGGGLRKRSKLVYE